MLPSPTAEDSQTTRPSSSVSGEVSRAPERTGFSLQDGVHGGLGLQPEAAARTQCASAPEQSVSGVREHRRRSETKPEAEIGGRPLRRVTGSSARSNFLRLAAACLPLLAAPLASAQEPPPAPAGPPPADAYQEPGEPSTEAQRPEAVSAVPEVASPNTGVGAGVAGPDAETVPPPATPSGAPPPLSPASPEAAEGPYGAPSAPGVYEPPPPPVYEPPPPLKPRHVAPRYSFWTGARAGYFMPFGDLLARCNDRYCQNVESIRWRDYASNGPLLEVDAGARLGRNYTVFLLWERAWLGAGNGEPDTQDGGNTDFWAVAVRFSSNPDRVGFLTEIAFGYRRARIDLGDGSKLKLDNAPFEARLGLGADIRLTKSFALSPMATLGVGRFDDVVIVEADGTKSDLVRDYEPIAHGSFTLQLGGHFDLFGKE